MNMRLISISSLLLWILSLTSSAQTWPILQADDLTQYYIISGTFGEIHPPGPNYPAHFHKAIDINCTENSVPIRPIENGVVISTGASSIVVGHGNQLPNLSWDRTSKYLHINPNLFTVGQAVVAGQTVLGIVDGSNSGLNNHLHLDMQVWNTTSNRYDYVNPLDNNSWQLTLPQGHGDTYDPVINNILIEPMSNETNNVPSGFHINDPNNHNGLTIITNQTQFLNAHINNSYFSTGTTYDYPNEKIILWGNIGFIINTRDKAVNYPSGSGSTLGGGRGLTIQRLKYEIEYNNNYHTKYIIDFKTINPAERNDIDQCFHIPYFDPAHFEFGNNDYIELRSADNTYLQIHEKITDHTGANINSNGIWFTKADNTTHHVFNQTPINIALTNEDALYKDGEHEIRFTVSDIVPAHEQEEELLVVVDNFLPFIKNVELRKVLNGESCYSRSWQWTGTTYLFEPPPCPGCPDIKTNNNLYVKIYTSESMDGVTLIINGHSVPCTSVTLDRIEWDFEIAANLLVTGENTLKINGSDLALNPIINYPPYIPVKQANNTWLPDPVPHTGADENHTFFAFTPGPVDFDATQIGTGLRNIYFEDKSTVQNINTYNWDFGDGDNATISYPNSPNVVHEYDIQGTYAVTYSIIHGGGSDFIEKNVLVETLIPPEAEYIFSILSPNDRADNEVIVDFYDDSEGIINSWSWNFNNGTATNHQQNPKGIVFNYYENYEIELEVRNEMGPSTIIKNFYYDPATSPYAQIIDWQQFSFFYNFDVYVDNLEGPYNYEIEYGDGTSETILNESLNWVTFDHQYFNWGTYLVKAYVAGTNLQGVEETVFSAKEITVSGWDLDVQLSFTAPTSPPRPGCQDVTIYADVSGAGNVNYWGNWYIYKIGDPDFIPFFENSSYGTSIELNYSFDTEGTYKVGFDATTQMNGGAGHDEIIIEVENAQQFIEAGFYPLEPIQLGTNSTQTFYSNTWPIGNPGVTESQWYPTNLKWTLFDSEENILQEDEELFDYDLFFLEHPQEYTFLQNGTYKVRLEAWNKEHNYVENGFINPECVNTVSYYDYVEKEIEVSDNIPYLEIIYPDPPQCLISLSAAAHDDIEITLTNPGEEPMTWYAIKSPGYNGNDFFTDPILSNTTISGGAVGIASFNVFENILDDEDNYGVIQITGYNSEGNHVQGSPTYVIIEQSGNKGPRGQFVYNNTPIAGENFGTAVSIDDKYAIIGAVDDNDNGKVYIAERDIVGYWHVVATLQATDGYTNKFGRSVDIHGEYAIVGAYEHHYIFKRPATGWSGTQNSIADGYMNYNSAHDVSIWGDYAAVSVSDLDHVKILYRNQQGITDSWNSCELLTGEYGTNFGYNIDLYNDLLAVGVPNKDKGEIHIFNRNYNQSNDWELEYILETPTGAGDDAFLGGKGFDIYDNKLFYAYRNDRVFPERPELYTNFFERNEDGNWSSILGSGWSSFARIYQESYDNFNSLAGSCCAIVPGINREPNSTPSGLFSRPYNFWADHPFPPAEVGGGASYHQWLDWVPAYGSEDAWNLGANFGTSLKSDFNSIINGGPNKNGSSINDCGAVYIRDSERVRSLCEAAIELVLLNFEKPSGNYPDVNALKITLGGKGYDAIIKSGANITYTAEEVVLDDGFLAEYGSEFVADTASCTIDEGKSMLPDNYGAIDEHSFVDGTILQTDNLDLQNILVVNLQDIRKRLIRNYPSYPFHQLDFITGIEQIDVVDTSYNAVSTIKNPNPIICIFDRKTLPDEYHIIIKVEGKSFLASSYKSPALRSREQSLEQLTK